MTYKYIDNPTDPQPERDLESGATFPFDASDEWMEREDRELPPPPPVDWAHAAARGIISNLRGRRGIKQELQIYNIDEDVRVEIITAIAAIIRKSSEAENAALRAQLAEREWWPISESPTEAGTYLAYYRDGELGVVDWHIVEDGGLWQSYSIIPFTHWQPLPAPPDSDEDEVSNHSSASPAPGRAARYAPRR